jgi:hypothetical protein
MKRRYRPAAANLWWSRSLGAVYCDQIVLICKVLFHCHFENVGVGAPGTKVGAFETSRET